MKPWGGQNKTASNITCQRGALWNQGVSLKTLGYLLSYLANPKSCFLVQASGTKRSSKHKIVLPVFSSTNPMKRLKPTMN